MGKVFYPAVFHIAEEGGFWVSFPDIPECLTEGDNMGDAYQMAWEALGLSLSYAVDHGEAVPSPSVPNEIPVDKDEFLAVIEFDLMEYRRKHCSRAVKKTLSIPEWLNEAAMKQNINFSQVLQEALMNKVKM